MKNREVRVVVCGRTGGGKTTIGYVLKNFLNEMGFEVEFEPNHDNPTEESFDKEALQNFNEKIEVIKADTKIILSEKFLLTDSIESTKIND